MPKLKRDVVKYVRDKAKSKYAKGSSCEICGETDVESMVNKEQTQS